MAKIGKGTAVLVTTANYGIYYGTLERAHKGVDRLVLRDARHVYYYSAGDGDNKGAWSLATHGPQAGSKLSPVMPRILVSKVAHVAECTRAAIEAFGAAGWGK